VTLTDRITRPGPKRLLALDGGGIRGLISLEILAEIEGQLRDRVGAGPAFVRADYFDYIGGTSTGGIIAALRRRPAVAGVGGYRDQPPVPARRALAPRSRGCSPTCATTSSFPALASTRLDWGTSTRAMSRGWTPPATWISSSGLGGPSGFPYERSMISDDRPYELLRNRQPTGLVEIPVEPSGG